MTRRILSRVKQTHNHFPQAVLLLPIRAALRCITPLLSARCVTAMSTFAIVCALAPLVFSAPGDPLRFRPGMRNSSGSHRLNAKQLQAVGESLCHKTGFLEMRFDESGFLSLGDRTRIAGGSPTARELLIAAVDGHKVFELEAHDYSPDVAFAKLGWKTIYRDFLTQARIEAQPLQLDFTDFAQLSGSRDALAAFDLGLVVLHELGHGALYLRDPIDPTQLGECEQYINRIRRELGLPERRSYFARNRIITVSSAGRTITQAELVFARVVEKQGRIKTKETYLRWDIQNVGQGATALRSGSYHMAPSSVIARR